MGQVRFLRFVEIAQKSAQRHGGGRLSGRQAGERLIAELRADALFRLCQTKAALAAVFIAAMELIGQNVRQGLFMERSVT